MARTHGRIQTAIWKDADFIAMDERAQRLYLFLTSQDDLSHAGLIPLRVKRWASKSPSLDEAGLMAALAVLERERFVVVDHATEELLIRTFVRNDGVYKQPKVMIRMREDARQIESRKLRAAFLVELDRLPLDELSDKPGGPNGDLPSPRSSVVAVVDTLRADFADAAGYPTEGVSDTPGEGYGVPPACARAHSPVPRPPSTVPLPPSPVPPSAGSAVALAAPGAQGLIAEWIDHLPGGRPPGRLVGQVAKELGAMLAEGIPYADVRAGLAAWQAKGLHPSALASVVHETRTPRGSTDKPSTTDTRVGQAIALAQRLALEDSA